MEMEEGHNQPKIAPKRMKLQEMVEKGEEDRISELPDCLLIEILSRLPSTKEAIRTGTLSKRWNHLWTLVPTLIFYLCDRNHRWSDFASFVDKTLTQRPQLKLKKFKLYTRYDIQCGSEVNNWIHYAINWKVEELKLMLWGTKYVFSLDQSFFINTCFTDLTLEGCMFNPIVAISWKNLRSLCISNGNLDKVLIENILSGSPLLETLVLNNCSGFRGLDITSKSVKKLVLDEFFDSSQFDTVEIKAPKLLSLTIKGCLWLRKLLLVNMSSLVEANLDYFMDPYEDIPFKEAEEEMLKSLILNLPHVKELKIGGSCSKVLARLKAKGFTFPSNMNFPDVASSSYSDNDLLDLDSL